MVRQVPRTAGDAYPRYAVGIEDRLSRLGAGEITPVGPLGIKTELMADLVLRPARQGEDRDQRDPENHSINLSSFIQDGLIGCPRR